MRRACAKNSRDGCDMKFTKALHEYFKDQVDAVNVRGGEWRAKTNGRTGSSILFSIAFHAALLIVIVSTIMSGRDQPSFLGQQIQLITERYSVEERLTQSIQGFIQFIKISRRAGGKL